MNNDDAWAHQMELERRKREEELIAAHRKKWRYHKRVLRDWFPAFGKRLQRTFKCQ